MYILPVYQVLLLALFAKQRLYHLILAIWRVLFFLLENNCVFLFLRPCEHQRIRL